jgi:predicted Zn finger-like uncharacterized protein
MNCPKCDTQMRVTHSIRAGNDAMTQRVECPKCNTVGTVQAILVNINPGHGEGAAAIAKKLARDRSSRTAI